MRVEWSKVLGTLSLGAVLCGCSRVEPKKPTPDEVREKTAQMTAEFKSNARAVAQGIREGWTRDHPLDLNSATKDQLVALPGVNESTADRIIARRPYTRPDELLSKRVVTKVEYDKFADRVTVKK
jgi:predicted DNA-binding helix-hairpin-helix protein